MCIWFYCCIFASEKETNNNLKPKTRKGTEIMTIAIEAQVTVYLYEQVTTHNTGVRNEIITCNQVYADKEKAMKALKVGEVPNIEDGMPYEGLIGESFQYHEEYDRNDGDHVWEIRRETRVREEDGWTIKYEANRVIEKKF